MIPIKLSLSGFLSYHDPVEIDFTTFELACISGTNGAGKSSLLDAVTWALFGNARKRDDSIINMQSSQAEVELTFEYEGNLYRVQRVKPKEKTTLLEFNIQTKNGSWKALTERTLRGTESLIESILRLDYETFVNASFFLQGKADQFTQQRPGDRKRILSSILGLEIWETYRKGAVEERKEVDAEIAALDGRLQEINTELGQEEERKARLKELEGNLKNTSESLDALKTSLEEMRLRAASLAEQEKLVNTLGDQAERTRQSIEETKARLEARQADKDAYNDVQKRAKEIEKKYNELKATRAELEIWNETAAKFNEQEKRRHDPITKIKTERARLEAELAQLQAQEEALAKAQEDKAGIETQQKELGAALEKVSATIQEKTRLEEELQAAITRHAEAKAENPVLKEEMDKLKANIEQLEGTDGALCPLCGQPLETHDREKLIEELNAEGKTRGDKYRDNVDYLKKADEKVKALEKQIAGFAQVDEEYRQQTRQLDQIESQLATLEETAKAWKKEGAARLKTIQTQLAKEDFAPEARKTLAEVDKELKKIGYEVDAHDAVRKKESDLRPVEEEFRQLENAQAALEPLEREIGELEKQVHDQEKTLAQQEKQHTDAAAALAAAQAGAPNLAETEQKVLDLQEEENKIRLEVGAAQQEVNVLGDLKKRVAEIEGTREGLAQKVAQYKALERAFGKDGVPAMLIEQALPQIETKANEVLERLSGGTMSVRFITQAAYKDAKRDDLKETLDIEISDSAGQRDYEMYSGGEAFRINFAIRLALSEVLAQRAGARLQTLVIDEGFGSQDEAGRQRLIEAINLVKEDFEKILVITHIDSLKDAFPNRIEVEKTPRGSVVTVV